MTERPDEPPFRRIGPDLPVSPVVLSVPHAGRHYSAELLRSARVSLPVLETLEDRFVDRLIWRAVAAGATAIVAQAPRAQIDLNRDEREIDPDMIVPAPPPSAVIASARTRGGLGLIPARLAGSGNLWRGRIGESELRQRIERIHRPYHDAIAAALDAAQDRFETAILIDCHSMPPRPAGHPGIVFGDRHGTTCDSFLLAEAGRIAQRHGFASAVNTPYAGGHIVERHSRPAGGRHALQIEIDRSLYLDRNLREPGAGFDRIARLLAALSEGLAAELAPPAIAAE